MRLHRRKEAGVVVDFAEAGAPHTERTVTLHSLLNVDAYRPGRPGHAAAQPPPPAAQAGQADHQGSCRGSSRSRTIPSGGSP